jgi:hypothetical protein
LDGTGEMSEQGIWAHFNLIPLFLQEAAIPVVLMTLIYVWQRRKMPLHMPNRKEVFFFLAVCGSSFLPMLLSTKQRGFYLLPALPWLAMALVAAALPTLTMLHIRTWNGLRPLLLLGILAVLGLTWLQAGTFGRDADLLKQIRHLKQEMPQGGTVFICPSETYNYSLNAYLQRYGPYRATLGDTKWDAALFRTGDCKTSQTSDRTFREGNWELVLGSN